MKKLTLVLCACAMALAMALVSCKNEPEKVVFDKDTSYQYIYTLTGSVVETVETGTPGNTTKVNTTNTIKNGHMSVVWEENKNQEINVYRNRYLQGYISYDTTDSASTVTYDHATEFDYTFEFDPIKNTYKVIDDDASAFSFTIAKGIPEATVTGDWEDDTVTISFTNITKDDSDETTIDKEYVVYTYVLTALGK